MNSESPDPSDKSNMMSIEDIVNMDLYPLDSPSYVEETRKELQTKTLITLPNFIKEVALQSIIEESIAKEDEAYYSNSSHNIFFTPPSAMDGKNLPELPSDHYSKQRFSTTKDKRLCDNGSTLRRLILKGPLL